LQTNGFQPAAKIPQGEQTMNANEEVLGKYEDENGETYYCPVNTVRDDRVVVEWELDNCVEASTAGRYSGNIHVADRFTS
jgi:hypothetical protein